MIIMKKSYILGAALSLLVLTLLGFYITQIIQPKYKPNTKEALILLVNNNKIDLGDICRIRTGKLNANAKDEDGIYPFFIDVL